MTPGYDPTGTIGLEKRLNEYSRQAGSMSNFSTAARTIGYGTLASIVPVVASVGEASGQVADCYTVFPVPGTQRTVDLSTTGGTGTNPDRLSFWALFSNQPAPIFAVGLLGNAPSVELVIAAQPFWDPLVDANGFAYRRSSSSSISGAGLTGPGVAILCEGSSSPAGAFCPPAGNGFMPVQWASGSGFLELEVLSFGGGKATVLFGEFLFGNPVAHAGDCPLILPVELVSFDAILDDGHPVLSWETASELNNAGFEIQRASAGNTFVKVGFVDGRGTTDQSQTYSFMDESVQPNTLYRYRLRQIDLDGTTSFSSVVEVFTEIPDMVAVSQVYPNPVNGLGARVDVNLAESEEATVEVYDIRGALVNSTVKTLSRGQNRLRLETEGLARGSHFAKIQVGDRVEYRSFIVAD